MFLPFFCFHLGRPWLCLLQGPCLPSFQRFLSGTPPQENALPLILFKGITNWGTWQEKPGTCFSSIRSPDSVSGAGDPEINEIYLLCPLTVSRRDEDRANNSCLGRYFTKNVTFDMDHAKWGGVNWMMSKRYFPSEGEMLMKSYNWENDGMFKELERTVWVDYSPHACTCYIRTRTCVRTGVDFCTYIHTYHLICVFVYMLKCTCVCVAICLCIYIQ